MNKGIFWLIIIALNLCSSRLFAGGDKWESITKADWDVHADSALKYRDAVMLFEKITADDNDWGKERVFLTIYDRIRIFSSEGRKHGDVTIPYIDDQQKIEELDGRTVLPDGKEFVLDKNQIHETEVIKSDDIKIKQKSFSLPGITNDCIVEYLIKIRLSGPNYLWRIQKEVPLLYGEYLWKYYRYWNPYSAELLTPNYHWSNTGNEGKVELLPDANKPEEVRFSISNVVALEEEPYMLAPDCVRSQLVLYYSNADAPDIYWNSQASANLKYLDEFVKDSDRLSAMVASFSTLATDYEKIAAAYRWIQENIQNASYAVKQKNGNDFKVNKNINDIIEHGYGSSLDLNILFYAILKKMNIEADLGFYVNRDDRLFMRSVKYWQFHGSLVAIGKPPDQYRYYSPGSLYLPCGYMPRYAEGTGGFIMNRTNIQFPMLPFSFADSNQIRRSYKVSLLPDGKMEGTFSETRFGQWARYSRLISHDVDSTDIIEKFRAGIKGQIENVVLDTIKIEGLHSLVTPVDAQSHIKFSGTTQQAGSRLLFQPYGNMASNANPFKSETRTRSILFDYPYTLFETMQIMLPKDYVIEGMPADTAFKNRYGAIRRTCLVSDSVLTVQRMFKLQISSIPFSSYTDIKDLFHSLENIDRLTIVLNKTTH